MLQSLFYKKKFDNTRSFKNLHSVCRLYGLDLQFESFRPEFLVSVISVICPLIDEKTIHGSQTGNDGATEVPFTSRFACACINVHLTLLLIPSLPFTTYIFFISAILRFTVILLLTIDQFYIHMYRNFFQVILSFLISVLCVC